MVGDLPQAGEEPRLPFAVYRLPRGRHRIPPELVAENQRWRLLGAAAEAIAERGYAHATARDIAARAGVSRTAFYRHFDDLEACLLAAYEMAAECLCDLIAEACQRQRGRGEEWPPRLRAAIDAALAFLASEPSLAHLLGAAPPAADAAIAAARERLVNRLAWPLRGSRDLHSEAASRLPADLEHRLIAAALGLISDRVAAGKVERLPELAPELTAVLLAPFLAAT